MYKKYIDIIIEYKIAKIYRDNRQIISSDVLKDVATFAIDEIILNSKESLKVAKELHPHAMGLVSGDITFWGQVKQEIERL